MRRRLFFTVFLLIIALSSYSICFAQATASEEITITTYYPSPYGTYKNLRLYPSEKPTGASVKEGLMYYDTDDHELRYRNDSKWVKLKGIDCRLVAFSPAKHDCPKGYYVWPGYSAQASGYMLCCTSSN